MAARALFHTDHESMAGTETERNAGLCSMP